MEAPKIYLEPVWSSRAFNIGMIVGALFACFFVVPSALWLFGASICAR